MHLYTTLTDVLNGLRRPEYTGENRCIPCTLGNVLIAVTLAAALSLLGLWPLGLGVFAVALAAIYFRGYLVPGTPELTKRYFPDVVLAAFGKGPRRFEGDLDVRETLVALGVLTDEDSSDVALDPAFARRWYVRMAEGDADTPRTADLAAMLDVPPERVDLEYHGAGACTAYVDDEWVGQWESRVAFDADVTADAVLTEAYPDWTHIPLEHRSELLAALRMCLETCPACGGDVTLGAETVESCCRTVDVAVADCADCGARLFEVELDPATFGGRDE